VYFIIKQNDSNNINKNSEPDMLVHACASSSGSRGRKIMNWRSEPWQSECETLTQKKKKKRKGKKGKIKNKTKNTKAGDRA
jgi:hypothetical protein